MNIDFKGKNAGTVSGLAVCVGLMIASQGFFLVGFSKIRGNFYLGLGMMLLSCLSLFGAARGYHFGVARHVDDIARRLHADDIGAFRKVVSRADVAMSWLSAIAFAMVLPNALSVGYRAGVSGLSMPITIVAAAFFVLVGYNIAVRSTPPGQHCPA